MTIREQIIRQLLLPSRAFVLAAAQGTFCEGLRKGSAAHAFSFNCAVLVALVPPDLHHGICSDGAREERPRQAFEGPPPHRQTLTTETFNHDV